MSVATPETRQGRPLLVLIADDSVQDYQLLHKAIKACCPAADLRGVQDSTELLDYLHQRGRFVGQQHPFPDVLLLATALPPLGFQALIEIKSDPTTRDLPIVILTAGPSRDILEGHEWGATSFIIKPISSGDINSTVHSLCNYWCHTLGC